MAQRIRYAKVGARRGFTLIEVLVVIGIVLVLMSLLIGGFGDMLRARRLANSVEKVVSTIHYARTRAIGDNAITHVRVENRAKDMQYIGVYRFRKVGEALQADTEKAVQDLGGWQYHPNFPGYNCEQLDKHELEVGVYFETQYDPDQSNLKGLWDDIRKRPKLLEVIHNPVDDLYYSGNWDKAADPFPVYFPAADGDAVNLLPKVASYSAGALMSSKHKLIYFLPDGTASHNCLLFVRDHNSLRWVQVWKGGLIRSGEIDRLDAFKDLN